MKKSMITLVVVLILAAALLAGCTANPAGQDGYQRGNGYGADEQDAEAATGYGNGTDEETLGTGVGYGNGYGNGNGNGGRGSYGDAYCITANDSLSSDVPVQADAEPGVAADTEGYGSAGALADADLTLADMLTYAIQDENLARAEYEYILDTFGSFAPFRNIIKAEEGHINQLLPLFAEYGVAVPEDTVSESVATVSSLTDAYQAGVDAEVSNIAMYDKFLAQELPADVRIVFENLRAASATHLEAFRVHL